MLRDSGDAQSMQLADSAVAAFQKAAGSAKIGKDAGPETPHAPADHHTIDIHTRCLLSSPSLGPTFWLGLWGLVIWFMHLSCQNRQGVSAVSCA